MFFLLSGEGITDIGDCERALGECEKDDFLAGPMTKIIDLLVEGKLGYSFFEAGSFSFVSKQSLIEEQETLPSKKKMRLPGAKSQKETAYYFQNARAMASIAKKRQIEEGAEVIAVLFRDGDGTASSGRGEWETKRRSMLEGFEQEGFFTGVPMIPKPKSEAWLLCALREPAYLHCDKLEERSGNDDAPNSLKSELSALLGDVDRQALCDLMDGDVKRIEPKKITMPSFVAFRERLFEVIGGQHETRDA